MSAGGISYDWTVEGKAPGVQEVISKVDVATASMGKLSAASKTTGDAAAKMGTAIAKAGMQYVTSLMSAGVPMERLEHLGKVLNSAGGSFKETPKQLSDGFKGVGQSISSAKSSMSAFFEFTGAIVAVELLKSVASAIADIGSHILEASGAAERMSLSLKLNVGAQGAKDVSEWIDKIWSKTKFTGDELLGWSNQLLRSGVNSKDIVKYMAASVDLAARGADMGSVVNTLGMASLKGAIGAKQLMGLGIRPDQLAELPGFKGLSKAALDKKIDSGTVTMPQVFKIIAGKDGVLGDEGVQAGNLLEAKIKNLKELPGGYYQQFAGSASYENMKTKLDEMFQSLDPKSERGKRIFDSMDRMFTVVVDKLVKVDFEKLANGLEKLVNVLFKIAGVVGNMTSLAGGAASGAGNLAGKAYDGATLLPRLLGGAFKHGADVVKGISEGVRSKMPDPIEAVTDMARGMSDAVTTTLEIQSPSKLFARHGKNVALGFAMGVEGGSASIDAAMGGAFSVSAPSGARAGGAGWGSPQISIEVNVDGRGKDGGDLAHMIAAEVAAVVPSMLLGAFEQSNMESGAA